MVEFLTLWKDYSLIALLIVLISLPLISIIYFVGKALANEQMVGWGKDELYQAIGSVIIIALTIMMLGLINDVALSVLGAGGFSCTQTPCQISIAEERLNGMTQLIVDYTADQLVTVGWLSTEYDAKITILPMLLPKNDACRLGMCISICPLAGLEILADNIYDSALDLIFAIIFTLKAQLVFLSFIQHALFPLLLVGGIALRSISLTRKVGGLLIAIALALFFVYPMLIIFQSYIISPNPNVFKLEFDQLLQEIHPELVDNPQQTLTFKQRIESALTVEVNGQKMDWITYQLFKPIQPAYSDANGVAHGGGILDATAAIIVWFAIQQVIMLYGIVAFVKETSPLFGGDVEIAGLSRLI